MLRYGKAVPQNKSTYTATLGDVYKYITSDSAKFATETLRQKLSSGMSKQEASEFKLLNFPTATFSGVFSYRNKEHLIKESPLLVLDFDHIDTPSELQTLQKSLLSDAYFPTRLLFVSPSGQGLKWVIRIDDWCGCSRTDYFNSLSNYIYATHGVKPDSSGKDITRLCFLCHDKNAIITNISNNDETH